MTMALSNTTVTPAPHVVARHFAAYLALPPPRGSLAYHVQRYLNATFRGVKPLGDNKFRAFYETRSGAHITDIFLSPSSDVGGGTEITSIHRSPGEPSPGSQRASVIARLGGGADQETARWARGLQSFIARREMDIPALF
jgi:hypothetical protein